LAEVGPRLMKMLRSRAISPTIPIRVTASTWWTYHNE